MTLLRNIQAAAIASDKPVSEVLRMCAVLAKRLGHEPLGQWVRLELEGYPDLDQVPDYRRHPVQVTCQVAGPLGSGATNVPVPHTAIPEKYREHVFNIALGDGAEKLEAFLEGDDKTLYMPVNQDLVLAYLADEGIFEGYTTVSAKRVVPVGVLKGVLASVRNRILDFALEIERENPDAGEAALGEAPVPQQIVTQHFNTTILGGTKNLAIAGRDAVQTVTNVSIGDWDSLQKALKVLGVPDTEIDELRDALDTDQGSEGIGEKTQGWIGKIMSKVKTGALALAGGVTVEMIIELIMKYLGLS